jgi:hypothetical protein
MRRIALLALALACTPVAPPAPTTVGVGSTTDLAGLVSQALTCSPSAITWSVTEPAGGTVTSAGLYTAPACGAVGVAVQGTYHVFASGCGKSVSVPINVTEDIVSLDVCGIPAGGSLCVSDPVVPPGGGVAFYAKLTFTCGDFVWTPSTPPGL